MIYTNPDLKKYFEQNICRWGDHNSQCVDVPRLRELLDAIDDDVADTEF